MSISVSGGEAQRISIGRALLSSPDLLLLDEPLTGLDRKLKDQILPFLKNIKAQTNLPIIYVTHHLEELSYLRCTGDVYGSRKNNLRHINISKLDRYTWTFYQFHSNCNINLV